MTLFGHLRTAPWAPTFDWYPTIEEVADRINVWHEDYPQRVPATIKVLKRLRSEMISVDFGSRLLRNSRLLGVHKTIFGNTSFGGQWRRVYVRVGNHVAPNWRLVPGYMRRLQANYWFRHTRVPTVERPQDWYRDFETIHPFQDGNGRVGGVVVAAYSHYLHPDKGYLAPNQ